MSPSEPRGRKAARGGNRYVIQKHAATPAALRPPPRTRRRDEELGGHPRPEPRSRRKAPCGPRRGPSDRIQHVRRHHSAGRIWRRHGDDLGSWPLVSRRRSAQGLCQRPPRIHARRREIARPLAPRAHALARRATVTKTGCSSKARTKRRAADAAATFWRRSRCRRRPAARWTRSPRARARSGSGTAIAKPATAGGRDPPAADRSVNSRRNCGRRPSSQAKKNSKSRAKATSQRQRPKRAPKPPPRPAAAKPHVKREARGGGGRAQAFGRRRRTGGRAAGCPISSRRVSPRCTTPRRAGREWLHEIKFDGYRIEARLDRGKVKLLTRKALDWTHRFERIAEAVAALPAETALLDGELVVENDKGVSSFSMLQTDLKDGRGDRFVYWVFDLLYLDGRDLTDEPLIERKAALQRLLKGNGKNGTNPLCRAFRRRRPGDFQACLRHESRRHRVEAARRALSSGAVGEFRQNQMPQRAGIRRRRLFSVDGACRKPSAR